MKKLLSSFIVVLTGLLATPAAQAQKFGYVDSEFVMGKLPAYAAAQQELNTLSGNWQKDIENQKKELDKLYRTYQAEEVLLTEAAKKKRQDEILKKEQEIKAYQNKIFGFEGQLFKKRQELTKPVQDQVFEAIERVAKKKQLAIVFDKAGDLTMLYTNPVHDYTEFVLEEMGLASEEKNQPGTKGSVQTVETPATPTDGVNADVTDVPPATRPVPRTRQPAQPVKRKN
ncbi:periplasmic chaperone for outer membrane proteins Skp [Hymenobacter roseosalivarius DSM 11622]|uniref:Periplasmic chaperone for outer membrane proteins Skp n=1 Tax=Hymenobacter roseosalivarius DSM 11622 TaxID=645990 RepID=A0A1W1UZU2_9BACT|nr:OmpH family outer membrane protein [Hymenobacter roseosalivarius]SMB86540.1 periplasmic chaperone for outer membrane proteins Skp [Hymenobacter roseosalivarius DSM 11622]